MSVLPLICELLMTTVPAPSVSMPPPASPAWLLLMTVLLSVNVQEPLSVVLNITTPPPSAVALLWSTTMSVSVRFTLPWSRMPPPLPAAPSPGDAMPFSTVKPSRTTVNPAGGVTLLGLMSKTRSRPLPLTATWPPLVLTMVSLLFAGLDALGMMSKSPV